MSRGLSTTGISVWQFHKMDINDRMKKMQFNLAEVEAFCSQSTEARSEKRYGSGACAVVLKMLQNQVLPFFIESEPCESSIMGCFLLRPSLYQCWAGITLGAGVQASSHIEHWRFSP
jgi:hypothetical protein